MKNRIAVFDYLKTISIVMVIITHFNWKNRAHPVFPFIINMAVPIFMITSGFLWSMSCDKIKSNLNENLYSIENIWKKFIRFTVPYIFIIIFQLFCVFVLNKQNYSFGNVIKIVWTGGMGPGSYYYPILIQLIFFFPIIYLIVHKFLLKGVALCGIINFLYEITIWAYGFSESSYRLLVFRYTFALACGIYLYFKKDYCFGKGKQSILRWTIMLCAGFVYIYAISYMGYKNKVFIFWTTTNMLTICWIFPIIFALYKMFKNSTVNFVAIISQASYHIFLVQMVYYSNLLRKFKLPIELRFPNMSIYNVLLFNILFLCFVGIVFYFISHYIEEYLIKLTKPYLIKLTKSL